MTDSKQLALLQQGAAPWNEWRRQNRSLEPRLSRADLRGLDLRGANLSDADLRGAKLKGCDLRKAILRFATLSDADLTGADLRQTDLRAASLRRARVVDANLQRAVLRHASCVETNFHGADLRGAEIYGVAAWRLAGAPRDQSNLIVRADPSEPAITVDNLEVAQFVFLLMNNPSIRDVIDTVGQKAVLILGRFKADRKAVLDQIRIRLREIDRVPILFDFDAPSSKGVFDTVKTLASMVRFVIADITEATSVIQEVTAIVADFHKVPVQPIIQNGFQPWAMFADLAARESVLPLRTYDTPATLLAAMESQIVAPAEKLAAHLGSMFHPPFAAQ